ncbi:MAG: hypothetical protein ACP5UJ_03765 [Athalassotoga sp.]|uniref:hypothetical protein n=1 Tax=Athalassotoga sp. TaxID=2022597 RepID=UPI003D08189C
MSKEDWEKEKKVLKGSADQIFTVSAIWGEIIIWLFIFLLVYSEFILSESFSKNLIKILIVGGIIVFLTWLGVFLIVRSRKWLRKREIEDDRDDK